MFELVGFEGGRGWGGVGGGGLQEEGLSLREGGVGTTAKPTGNSNSARPTHLEEDAARHREVWVAVLGLVLVADYWGVGVGVMISVLLPFATNKLLHPTIPPTHHKPTIPQTNALTHPPTHPPTQPADTREPPGSPASLALRGAAADDHKLLRGAQPVRLGLLPRHLAVGVLFGRLRSGACDNCECVLRGACVVR